MLTVIAFLVALGLLVAIHEYGHYRMARFFGVKVIKFSVGFGKTVARWQPVGSTTEFVLGAIPLGGYVKMLDEREAPVAPDERHLAFNTQPLRSRAAIVAAGPAANLVLAVFLYAIVNWVGMQQAAPLLAKPLPGSVAETAGFSGAERVLSVGLLGGIQQKIASFEDFRWHVTQAAMESSDLVVTFGEAATDRTRQLTLNLSSLNVREIDAALFRKIGFLGPLTRPVIGEIMPGGAAAQAGLMAGDVVLRLGATEIVDGQQLRELIRGGVGSASGQTDKWIILRGSSELTIVVQPQPVEESGVRVGRIGAYVGAPPDLVTVSYGVLEGLTRGIQRTWEVSVLSLKMIGKMLIGEASIKNLSGPLTIADYAGKSASLGLNQYLLFLALISVSLGVMNLLPLPMLDGGHLMYYLWEAATGKVVTDAWLERFQRGGAAVLIAMMAVAIYNDISRLFG